MSMLQFTNVTGGYPGTRVLDGVDLDVDEGRVLALLGRNGVGKTTLMHTAMGMLSATGSIRFRDQELLGRPVHTIARAGLALVPQGRRVFGPLTVEQNLTIAARTNERRSRWNIADVYALFPRLEERRRSGAGQLSGGEQEMLSIGRALVTNPDLLLLDEPSDGLAPAIVSLVGDVLTTLAAEGVTILLVEQNLSLAMRVAHDVAVMSKGRIVHKTTAASFAEDEQRIRSLLGVDVGVRE